MRVIKSAILPAFCLALILAATYVWPTRYSYRTAVTPAAGSILIRTNRFTGDMVYQWLPGGYGFATQPHGWRQM